MGAKGCDDQRHNGAEQEASVIEGISHGQNSGAQGALEQMEKGACRSADKEMTSVTIGNKGGNDPTYEVGFSTTRCSNGL